MIPFRGTRDAVCPIAHIPSLDELESAAAFRAPPIVPYKCRAPVEWLKVRRSEPMTNCSISWRYSSFEVIEL